MKLNLQPYNHTESTRERALSALKTIGRECAAESVDIVVKDDLVERARAAKLKWLSSTGGLLSKKKRYAKIRLKRIAARAAAAR